jgi:phenol hydroxylase P1 protein
VAQNLVFDGLLYPLVYRHYVAAANPRTGNALALLTAFMPEWFDETARWVDATVATAAAGSPANARQLFDWYVTWRDEVLRALAPLAQRALGPGERLAALRAELDQRAARLGLPTTA